MSMRKGTLRRRHVGRGIHGLEACPDETTRDDSLPLHPRQLQRMQRARARHEKESKKEVEEVEPRADSIWGVTADGVEAAAKKAAADASALAAQAAALAALEREEEETDGTDGFEDALDDQAVVRLERGRLWSAPVWDAAVAGNAQALVVLAARGQPLDCPHPRSGITPLWAACENGHVSVVQLLLGHMGCDPNARANDGSTPLFAASQNGHADVVATLLELSGGGQASADPIPQQQTKVRLDLARGTDGATPLYVAAQRAHTAVVRLLLYAGAEPNRQRKGGFSALWTACDKGHGNVVELFMATTSTANQQQPFKCSAVDFSLASSSGVTPAGAARRRGHRYLSKLVEQTARHQRHESKSRKVQREGGGSPRKGSLAVLGGHDKNVVGWDQSGEDCNDSETTRMQDTVAEVRPLGKHKKGQAPGGAHEKGPNHDGDDSSEEKRDVGDDRDEGNTGVLSARMVAGEQQLEGGEDKPLLSLPARPSTPRPLPPPPPPLRTPGSRPEDSIFVYSQPRDWGSWECYIRQNAMYTHDLCKCVTRARDLATQGAEIASGREKPRPWAVEKCSWWRRNPALAALEPCQISLALLEQVAGLHAHVAARNSSAAGGHEGEGRRQSSLLLTQCLFTESRGEESRRAHTLELRFTHPPPPPKRRGKRDVIAAEHSDDGTKNNSSSSESKSGSLPGQRREVPAREYTDPRLVRRDEVVLLLGLPLRFPADGRVRLHCMQGRERLPAQVLSQPQQLDGHDEDGKAEEKETGNKNASAEEALSPLIENEEGGGQDSQGIDDSEEGGAAAMDEKREEGGSSSDGDDESQHSSVSASTTSSLNSSSSSQHPSTPLPGDLLSLTWITPEVWPTKYTLADFASDLCTRIEACAPRQQSDTGAGTGTDPAAITSATTTTTTEPLMACGLGPVPRPTLNIAHADAVLRRNQAFALQAEAERRAKMEAPLSPEEIKARRLAFFGIALQFALLGVLLAFREFGW